jgi:tetratricopeptide (TPR) repeat protein
VIEKRSLFWLLLSFSVLVAYWPAMRAPFDFDDIDSIQSNASIRQLWPVSVPLRPPTGVSVSGRPLVNFSFALNYALDARIRREEGPAQAGSNTIVFHVTNVLLHLGCGVMLFGLLGRTLRTPRISPTFRVWSEEISGAVVAIWLLHPLESEAVNYVVQRTELLVSIFYVAAVYSSVRAWSTDVASHRRWWYAAAVTACAAGLASKEVMITAPLMILLYDVTLVSGSLRQALTGHDGRRWFYVALAATSALGLFAIAGGSRSGTVGFELGMPWYRYMYSQGWAIEHYIRLLLWPQGLTYDYGVRPIGGVRALWGALVVSALGAAIVIAFWRKSPLSLAGLWFFVILAPSSSIVPITTEIAAERRPYLAVVSLILLAVLGAVWVVLPPATRGNETHAGWRTLVWRNRRWLLASLCALLLTLTYQRSRLYAQPIALWRDAARHVPANARALNSIGLLLLEQRPPAVVQAESTFRRAIDVDSSYPSTWANLALLQARQGRSAEAVTTLTRSLAVNPDYLPVVSALGVILVQMGHAKEAVHHLERVTAEYPSADSWLALGSAYLGVGRPDLAVEPLRRALAAMPQNVEASIALGRAYAELGRAADAISLLENVTAHVTAPRGSAALALAYAKAGQSQHALELAFSAAQEAPNDAVVLLLCARTLLFLQRLPEADQFMAAAVRLEPGDPEALTRYGMLKLARGERDAGAELFRKALAAEPAYAPARRGLESLDSRESTP